MVADILSEKRQRYELADAKNGNHLESMSEKSPSPVAADPAKRERRINWRVRATARLVTTAGTILRTCVKALEARQVHCSKLSNFSSAAGVPLRRIASKFSRISALGSDETAETATMLCLTWARKCAA